MFDRDISFALLLIWLLAGIAFAAIWFAAAGQLPPVWARCLAGIALFPVLMPLEASLARRYQRRRDGRARKTHAR